jgi:hypothetical protein
MKKLLLAVVLMVGMALILQAQELETGGTNTTPQEPSTSTGSVDSEESESRLGGLVRVGYSFPFVSGLLGAFNDSEANSTGEVVAIGLAKMALAFGFSSLSVGGGVQYDFIPHIIVPGIYLDMNFNLLSWAIMNIFEQSLVMFQLGLRVYNQFSVSFFGFEPFFGGNFVYLKFNELTMPIFLLAAGFVINLGRFSFELGYHFSPATYDDIKLPGLIRITFGGIVWKKE